MTVPPAADLLYDGLVRTFPDWTFERDGGYITASRPGSARVYRETSVAVLESILSRIHDEEQVAAALARLSRGVTLPAHKPAHGRVM